MTGTDIFKRAERGARAFMLEFKALEADARGAYARHNHLQAQMVCWTAMELARSMGFLLHVNCRPDQPRELTFELHYDLPAVTRHVR